MVQMIKQSLFVTLIVGYLVLSVNFSDNVDALSRKNLRKLQRTRGAGGRGRENASKRSKYFDEDVDYNRHVNKKSSESYENEEVSNFATEDTPVFWKSSSSRDHKGAFKKNEEGLAADGGFELGPDELPSTVGPNENIYGGFPVNDMLGGFELPSVETLAILKAALKKYGPRNEYEAELHHDLENWAYGYEHHALPEYDVKDTPPFYVTMLQNLKMAEEGKKKPGCQQGSSACHPMFQLNDDQCNQLAGNCMPSKPIPSGSYEQPCPWKIMEMLFGCKKPAKPKVPAEKPEGLAPPAPKPDAPEEPAEKKPDKGEEESDSKGKPKPIPIQLEEGHATPEHIEKQVQEVKNKASGDEGAHASSDTRHNTGKITSQLALLGVLKSLASGNEQGKMNTEQPKSNATLKESKNGDEKPSSGASQNGAGQNGASQNGASQNGASQKKPDDKAVSGNDADASHDLKQVIDLGTLNVPQEIQVGQLGKRNLKRPHNRKALRKGRSTKGHVRSSKKISPRKVREDRI